jgi:hypothetical protein
VSGKSARSNGQHGLPLDMQLRGRRGSQSHEKWALAMLGHLSVSHSAAAGGVAGGRAGEGGARALVPGARPAGASIRGPRILLQLLVLEDRPVEHVVPLVACIARCCSALSR